VIDTLPAGASPLASVGVYCGSSAEVSAALLDAADYLGAALATSTLRMVYGGGGRGLMGACARGALAAGGLVIGVLPEFLVEVEQSVEGIDLVLVATMQERKLRMFEEADAFVVLPGGIGTLEEAIELLSWRKLNLHAKPIVFYNPDGFWNDLFALFDRFTAQRLAPPWFNDCWRAVANIPAVLPTLRSMASAPRDRA